MICIKTHIHGSDQEQSWGIRAQIRHRKRVLKEPDDFVVPLHLTDLGEERFQNRIVVYFHLSHDRLYMIPSPLSPSLSFSSFDYDKVENEEEETNSRFSGLDSGMEGRVLGRVLI